MPPRELAFMRRMIAMMLTGCGALLLGIFLDTPDAKDDA